MPQPELKTFYAKDRKAWRKWLEKNHDSSPGIWLIYYKAKSGKARVAYNEAVEEVGESGVVSRESGNYPDKFM